MKSIKKWLTLLGLLSLLLLIAGCASNYEPDALSYVLLIGIDEGSQNTLRISYLIATPGIWQELVPRKAAAVQSRVLLPRW